MNEKDQIQARIEEACERQEAARAELVRPDGSRYYGDEEAGEREQAIEREFRASMDRVEAGIEERIERSQEELLVAEHAVPSSSLTTAELERARAMSQFVADDVERLSTADLVQRCRAATAAGDRPTMFVLQHHATQRSNRHPDGDLGGELRDAARELRAKLDPDAESRLAAARAALEEGDDLRLKAQLARAGATSLGDAYARGAYWGAGS